MNRRLLGIMQGRLVAPIENRIQAFPREQWAAEFANAAAAGIDAIEWIYDTYGLGVNPVETAEGIERTNRLAAEHKVAVRSLCADYFMDFAFVRATETERWERVEHLIWLMGRARQIGVTRIVLPFVDQSAIRDEADTQHVIEALRRALPCARATGIELHLETSLAPVEFAQLLARIPDPLVKVNYDSGNSSSLGYRPVEEFAAYGNRLGSVHIKDRILGGTTVPLGEGDADLTAVFTELRRLNYPGDFVLQVARGKVGDEVAWARSNRQILQGFLALHATQSA